MAREGLGPHWECLLANDFDAKKARAYIANWGADHFIEGDVRAIKNEQLVGNPDMIWASFPCQDLSLAGQGEGLLGDRSSTVLEVWRIIAHLQRTEREPSLIVFENVCGLITSRGGADFENIVRSFHQSGYKVGALVIDAMDFLPQSRKRIFFVATKAGIKINENLTSDVPSIKFSSHGLIRAVEKLPEQLSKSWIWWKLPKPEAKVKSLQEIVESENEVEWNTGEKTAKILSQMNEKNFEKIRKLAESTTLEYATVFRRTRLEDGKKVVRAEVRDDGVAGCLRTPNGGSSKQILIEIRGDNIRSRHITGREGARLMGLPEAYEIPTNANQALYLAGDGVAVPVVAFLSDNILRPILELNERDVEYSRVSLQANAA